MQKHASATKAHTHPVNFLICAMRVLCMAPCEILVICFLGAENHVSLLILHNNYSNLRKVNVMFIIVLALDILRKCTHDCNFLTMNIGESS